MTDRQTDRRTDRLTDGRPGKNNMSPVPKARIELKPFSSYRADPICDRQTDRRTDGRPGKTICLSTLKGRDINIT